MEPEIVGKQPIELLDVSFRFQSDKNELRMFPIYPFDLVDPEYIDQAYPEFTAREIKYQKEYCLLLIDADYCPRKLANPKDKCFLHYFLGNINSNSYVTPGRLEFYENLFMVPYLPPVPRKYHGVHRYIFLFYEQKQKHISYGAHFNSLLKNFNLRKDFDLTEFELEFELKLVAANFFYCGHQHDIDVLKNGKRIFSLSNGIMKQSQCHRNDGII